jgi:hypothetical protein
VVIVRRIVLLCVWLLFRAFYVTGQMADHALHLGRWSHWGLALIVYAGPPFVLAVVLYLVDRFANFRPLA